MKYANIIVNISHENLDKTFQYLVPENLKEIISVGDYVTIPFGKGNRLIEGYVLELTDKAAYDESKLKEIAGIRTDARLVEVRLIKLAWWMKKRYGSTMINALKTVLPVKKQVKEKEEKTIVLNLERIEALSRLEMYAKKHQTARERLLKELISEGELDYRLVTTKLSISPPTIRAMEEQDVISIRRRRLYRDPAQGSPTGTQVTLNPAQLNIVNEVTGEYDEGIRRTYLLRGVTGSGKTEVYMEIISHVIGMGREVIVLIPEIALTYQTVMRFYKRFGSRVSTIHSRLSDGVKYDQFERARKGEISIMIGPRSALFTPFENLGLIIIDEEHEPSYKSDNMPKYHARETAIELARLHNASLILGSATPSLDAYYKALKGEYRLFELDERAKDAVLPRVRITDLKQELKDGNRSMFGRELKMLMEDRLNKGEQIMLFLNRRGYAGFVSCRSCGHVVRCPHCDVSLSKHRGGKLICHYCGYEREDVKICPECGSSLIGGMRAGTEQVEEAVKKLFPYASVLRMDADTTKKKDDYERILSTFANREADILIGTQMIVKGHDFPYVTLMGILVADMSLNAGDYRAAERTFQLLTQAAGRSGRADLPGDVVIQTYHPDHYAIRHAANQDYSAFYNEEIIYRNLLDYPPAGHMMAVMIEGTSEDKADKYSILLAEELKNDIIMNLYGDRCRIIGPADASVKKINDIYRKLIYLKSGDIDVLTGLKDRIEDTVNTNKDKDIRVTFDLDPV
ncbi:MAG TPA: primosomal protein N' [Lachnospiraceae bacterium]|nr:primosomal protein N' [Lachnospiraceae bacterium]